MAEKVVRPWPDRRLRPCVVWRPRRAVDTSTNRRQEFLCRCIASMEQAAGSCCASPYIDTQWRIQRGMRAMHPPMAYSNFLPVKKLPAIIAYMVYLLVIWSWQTVTNRSNFLTQMHKKRLATGLPRARRKRGLSALPRPSS